MPAPDSRAGAAVTWDRQAARYGRQARWELRSLWTAAALARPDADDAVIDVGTGTGLLLEVLRVRPLVPRRVVAVDRSSGMLAQVPPLPDGWSVVTADAAALPLAGASFDVAVAAYIVQILDRSAQAAVLAELHRVLRPGGRLVTVTPHVPRRGAGRLGAAMLDGAAAVAPVRLGGLRTDDVRPALARAGFVVERAAQRRHGYPSLIVCARRP
jgi:ubiquinone/menaquinone biosynthesis C-methylase UbiE